MTPAQRVSTPTRLPRRASPPEDGACLVHDLAHSDVAAQADERVPGYSADGDGLEGRSAPPLWRAPPPKMKQSGPAQTRAAYVQKCCGCAMLICGMAQTTARQALLSARLVTSSLGGDGATMRSPGAFNATSSCILLSSVDALKASALRNNLRFLLEKMASTVSVHCQAARAEWQ